MVRVLQMAAFFGALTLTGCSGGSVSVAPVKGKVTLDKKPLKDGEIYFVTPGKPPEVLPIKDGAYEGTVEVGDRRVEIAAYKTVPGFAMEGETAEPSKINTLPERYSSASQLRGKVTEDGPNELNFDLTSNR